jgi:hypothetical protein
MEDGATERVPSLGRVRDWEDGDRFSGRPPSRVRAWKTSVAGPMLRAVAELTSRPPGQPSTPRALPARGVFMYLLAMPFPLGETRCNPAAKLGGECRSG